MTKRRRTDGIFNPRLVLAAEKKRKSGALVRGDVTMQIHRLYKIDNFVGNRDHAAIQ